MTLVTTNAYFIADQCWFIFALFNRVAEITGISNCELIVDMNHETDIPIHLGLHRGNSKNIYLLEINKE